MLNKLHRLAMQSIVMVLVLIGSSCDPEELAPTLPEILSSSGQAWRVTALVVNGDLVQESLYTSIRYSFNLDAEGNPSTYSASNINSTLADQGYLPDYYSSINQGTWALGAGSALIFDEGEFSQSKVQIGPDPQPERILLIWLVPESFDKTAPEVEMFLAPAN